MTKHHESENHNEAEEATTIAAETMTGDLMQCLIEEFKAA